MNRNRNRATVNGTETETKGKPKFDWIKAGKKLLRITELTFAGIGAVGIGSIAYDKIQARRSRKMPTDIPSGPET